MRNLHTSDAACAARISVLEKTDDLISALQLLRGRFAAGNVAANAPAATDREPTSDEQAAPGLLDLIMRDIWQIDDCVTQVDGILCLALKTLSIVADGFTGNPLIHDVSALERALQLGRERLEFASERLGEISMGISREGEKG